jgi:alpha-D-xyloside xylohydrolase
MRKLAVNTAGRFAWTTSIQVTVAALLLASCLRGVSQDMPKAHAHADVVTGHVRAGNAEMIHLTNGLLRIKPCADNIVRVTYSPGSSIPDLSNPVMPDSICGATSFTVKDTDREIVISTPGLEIGVRRNTGAIRFGSQANPLLTESDWPFPRSVTPTTTYGEATHRPSVWFALTPEESLYGLGQHQSGILNQRNLQLELSQDNTNISIPFFLSSKGYGVLWNNASVTDWNNRFRQVLAIRSSAGDAVDYYFIQGPSFDRILAGYRQLTGQAPMFPRWAYGYWQSKLAYASTDELLATAAKYRELHIPLDNIVLDAGWETVFGSHIFTGKYPDPKTMVQKLHDEHVHLMASIWPLYQPGTANFDDMLKKGFFVTQGANQLPPYLEGVRFYDAFNTGARDLYWQQAKQALYDIGVDALWLDSTEPSDMFGEEHDPLLAGATTALGNGSKYANLFPLMTTAAIYNGQRSLTNNKRVFILTRSAFTGMQRNAAVAWSGDTTTTFDTFKRQIPAGLNYSMTGLPYWTTDIGGFVGGNTDDPAYRELFVRWFEYGAFCPIFRAHGARNNNQNELWSFGADAQQILTLYDRLRYRLMPYIYTLAARTTLDGYTPMRSLAFDFRDDAKAIDISDEFMLGPALLVAPVTDAGATARTVYLPRGTDWYDFWTGQRIAGGQTINRAAPLSVLPLYVRAGTVLPLGPEEEYAGQHPDAPVELRIYAGANADGDLYQDDGLTYNYEKRQFAWTPIHWDDTTRTLSLGAQRGHFPGNPARQDFRVTIVTPQHGIGEAVTTGDRSVTYSGTSRQLHF